MSHTLRGLRDTLLGIGDRREHRRAGRIARLAVVTLALAACTAEERSDRADRARIAMVGLSASELNACAGEPDAVRRGDGIEVRTYGVGAVGRAYTGPPSTRLDDDSVFARGTQVGVSSGISVPGRIQSTYCETVVTLVESRVSRVEYRAPSGIRIGDFGTRYAECERTVAACLARVEQRIDQGPPSPPVDETPRTP